MIDPSTPPLFDGPGEMRARCRALDWAATPLGPPEGWPAALRAVVRTAMESPFPINLWCGAERVLIYNDGYRGVLGGKHPAALGTPGAEVWSEIWSEIAPMFPRVSAGEPIFLQDAPFVMRRSGEPKGGEANAWFTFSLSAVRDEAGATVAFLNIVSETTARVLAERATEAARSVADRERQRMTSVLDSISDAFFALDPEWRFTYINDRAEQVLLRGRDELLGRNIWQEFAPAIGSTFEREYRRAVDTRMPVVFEEWYAPLETWFEVRAYPGPDGLTVYFQDVNERHQAAASLAASEARFRTVQDASPDASVLARAVRDEAGDIVDFVFTYANAATQRVLLGRSPDEPEAIVGRTLREAFPESTERLAKYQRVVETGTPFQEDVQYRRGEVTQGLRVAAVRVGDGVHIAAVDLTDRMRAAAERERLLDEARLARVVAERAQMEADDANRAKSEFLATMSHELRTPINAIIGYADLMDFGIGGQLPLAQQGYVARIQSSGRHLLGLIEDVLDLAKIESGRMRVDLAPRDLCATVEASLALVRPQATAKNIEVANLCPDSPHPYLGDEDRVRQILVNLLSNAVKFTDPTGRVTITSGTATEPAPGASLPGAGPWTWVRVTDSGIGIAPENREAVFHPFVQEDSGLTRNQGGTGLGLTISREFARLMRGDITLDSEPAAGAVFTLWLPAPGE